MLFSIPEEKIFIERVEDVVVRGDYILFILSMGSDSVL